MRHSPLDGSDSGTRDGAKAAGGSDSSAGLGALVDRVRTLLGRVDAAVRRFLGPGDGGWDASERDRPDGPDDAVERLVERSAPATEGDGAAKPVVSDRSERKPVPAGVEDVPRDPPELVARQQDGRLTLSEPDEVGARISSDTWWDVER